MPEERSPFTVRRADAALIESHAAAIDAIHEGKAGRVAPLARHAARPDATVLLACDRDHPIAVGSLFIHGRLAYLADAATHPGFRKRGAQRALIAERLRLAAAAGCTHAASETLSFLDASLANLRHAGFREAFSWLVFEFGASPKPPD